MKVLITGGAGYIGSTIASACLDAGITPVILDDLSTGRAEFTAGRPFYEGDIADGALLGRAFADHPEISAVVHCAARINVPESVEQPLEYYRENVAKTVDLLQHLGRLGCERFVFSSSASVYRPGDDLSVDEESALAPQSPYARTKMIMELALRDVAATGALRVISLRYFNPIGADPQLRTGLADPEPTHAVGKLISAHQEGGTFRVTGVDYATRDGSAIRDYIHVWDLARAHVAALERFDDVVGPDGFEVVNLGTGLGTTVRELVAAGREVLGDTFSVEDAPPRPGDVIGCYTTNAKARRVLGWGPQLSIADGIRDALAWSAKRDEVLGTG